MEIWLDSINIELIQEAEQLRLISGVTTNPAILSHAKDADHTLHQLLTVQRGKVAVQVTATTSVGMIEQSRHLSHLSDRIVVKIPVNRQGLVAMSELIQEKICILATAVLHPRQALLAAMLGATYVAPYVSHIPDALHVLQSMQDTFRVQSLPTQIMAASLKQVDHILECAKMGIPVVTIKDELFNSLIEDHPQSEAFTLKFNHQWQMAFPHHPILSS